MVRKKSLYFDLILLTLICPRCYCAQEGKNRSLGDSLLPEGILRTDVKHSQNTNAVPRYEVFEITFKHENKYENPFFDVTIEVIFTSPSKKQIRVGGFHYGSSTGPVIRTRKVQTGRGQRQQVTYHFDKQDLWKARFTPSELGKWKYKFIFENVKEQKRTGKGSFLCVKGRRPNKGFVRRHPTNPFRFVFDDGSPYFPIGLQDCWGDNSGTGSVLDQCSMGQIPSTRRLELLHLLARNENQVGFCLYWQRGADPAGSLVLRRGDA